MPALRMGAYDSHTGQKANPFDDHGSPASHPSAADHAPHGSPAPYSGPARGAVAGAYSPAVDTLMDERDTYMANKAGMDAKWQGSDLLQRALARHRGEKVEDKPIKPELGAPTSRSQSSAAPTAAPKAAAPSSAPAASGGLSEQEIYMQRTAHFEKKAAGDDLLQRALARHRGEKVEDKAIKPELGAPKSSRPLASPEAVMAGIHASSAPAPKAAPAPPAPAPHSGPSERDVYMANNAASEERAQKDVWLQRALERYGKK